MAACMILQKWRYSGADIKGCSFLTSMLIRIITLKMIQAMIPPGPGSWAGKAMLLLSICHHILTETMSNPRQTGASAGYIQLCRWTNYGGPCRGWILKNSIISSAKNPTLNGQYTYMKNTRPLFTAAW